MKSHDVTKVTAKVKSGDGVEYRNKTLQMTDIYCYPRQTLNFTLPFCWALRLTAMPKMFKVALKAKASKIWLKAA